MGGGGGGGRVGVWRLASAQDTPCMAGLGALALAALLCGHLSLGFAPSPPRARGSLAAALSTKASTPESSLSFPEVFSDEWEIDCYSRPGTPYHTSCIEV